MCPGTIATGSRVTERPAPEIDPNVVRVEGIEERDHLRSRRPRVVEQRGTHGR
jgi:hypothetical protein